MIIDPTHLQVYSSMEHLSQLEQKATTSVSRREHKGQREDKVTKRDSLGSFSMRDKSWRTGSPEMWVASFSMHFVVSLINIRGDLPNELELMVFLRVISAPLLSYTPVCLSISFLPHWLRFTTFCTWKTVQEFTLHTANLESEIKWLAPIVHILYIHICCQLADSCPT